MIFTLGSALVATGLALFLAYLNTRTNIPFKFMFGIISLIPMMVPHILFAVSWVLLLNPSNGMINLFLRQVFGWEGAALNIYTLKGMILVEGLLDLPIAYLVIAPAMSAFDVSLEESSRVCGASNWRTLFRVTLPVLRPAILAAMTLVIVRSLASFAVPSVIGMPGQIYVLATHIYRIVATGLRHGLRNGGGGGDERPGRLHHAHRPVPAPDPGRREVRDRLQQGLPAERDRPQGGQVSALRDRRPALLRADRPAGHRPVLHVARTLLMTPSAKAFAMMSWRHWLAVLKDPVSLLSLKNSLYLGIGGATLGMILSFFVAYVIVKVRTKASGFLESLSFLSFSFPGIVVGIGFMWFFVQTPLYSTIWALLIGYIATYLPYGLRPLTSAFVQIHSNLEESSRVCGGGPLYTMRRIVLPLLIPGIVSGWILMATMFVRELSLSVVLSRPGTEVLAVQILRFAEDGLWGRLSALGILMIFISTALVVLASLIGKKLTKRD